VSAEPAGRLSFEDYLASLAADAASTSSVAAAVGLDPPVPTCPGWTVLDLVRHCADVYSHKASVLQLGRRPLPGEWRAADDVPPEGVVAHHDAMLADLVGLLRTAGPDQRCWVWMHGEDRVGAWARRMAHEALVHRVDIEVAAGLAVSPAAPGLAADGIDEVLTWFVADPGVLAAPGADDGGSGTVLVRAGGRAWLVGLPDGGLHVTPSAGDEAVAARLTGDPLAVDLALWGRRVPGLGVGEGGEPAVLQRLHARIDLATQ
jgi:uncharacterized protein (TIGR03083 family)